MVSNTLAILKTTSLFNSFTLFNHEVCIHVLLVLTTKNNCQIFWTYVVNFGSIVYMSLPIIASREIVFVQNLSNRG
jgi:hypothetical protein